jgi:hypothetical protein
LAINNFRKCSLALTSTEYVLKEKVMNIIQEESLMYRQDSKDDTWEPPTHDSSAAPASSPAPEPSPAPTHSAAAPEKEPKERSMAAGLCALIDGFHFEVYGVKFWGY